MKAIVFDGAARWMKVADLPLPSIKPGQLILKVKHCGICGTDVKIAQGNASVPVEVGAVTGHEFCGEVVEIGAGVEGWKTGDRATSLPLIGCGLCRACVVGEPVWCQQMRSLAFGQVPGGFAEYVAVGAMSTVKLPEGVSWQEGALTEPLASALHGLRRARFEPGSDILVWGTGALGLSIILWARALGARHIVATARSSRTADMAIRLGATEFVEGDRDVAAIFAKLTGGPPATIFECVGAPDILDKCIGAVAPRGQVIAMGDCKGPVVFHSAPALYKEIDLRFSLEYSVQDYQAVVDLIAQGRIDPTQMISEEIDFAALPAMIDQLGRPHDKYKVLLTPGLAG